MLDKRFKEQEGREGTRRTKRARARARKKSRRALDIAQTPIQ
jgi:hypothetical protein